MKERKQVLSVEHLWVSFTQYQQGLRRMELPVISDLSLSVGAGEMVAVAGSSGSGKSLLAHAVLGILPYNAAMGGQVRYQGEELNEKNRKQLLGREIVLVPQSVSYLDPLMKAGPQIRKGKRDKKSREKSLAVLNRYGLGPETEKLYPFQLSGGMTRRVLISTAVMEEPRLVIADEPTPGLDMEAAKRVLSHFREMADQGAAVLLITHDLELAVQAADRIVVFYAGTNVEEALAEDFSRRDRLRHPYTRALYDAMPQHGFEPVKGTQPYGRDMDEGCPYKPRCPVAGEECLGHIPYQELRGGFVRCVKC